MPKPHGGKLINRYIKKDTTTDIPKYEINTNSITEPVTNDSDEEEFCDEKEPVKVINYYLLTFI